MFRLINLLICRGRQLNVTLWDQYASQLNSYLTNNKNETHVIILQFGVVKFYKDKAYLNNAYTVSRLFINSDIEEIKAFKKRYLGDVEPQNTSSAQHGVGSSILSTLHDEFLIDNDFNFVADIADIKQAKNVIVVGTIKAISLDTLWYYYACEQCKFKVIPKTVDAEKQETGASFENDCKPEYECANPNCNSDAIAVVPR
ncbi:uncharacterized protein LOC143607973 isoform X1 [Bidens hawaiensis]|uniref:uncharacterized protein LOC143607973 isoform X1 n=1 Tax=Bidens hawaiensis TaxID=980011 RepID=UPI00404B3F98